MAPTAVNYQQFDGSSYKKAKILGKVFFNSEDFRED